MGDAFSILYKKGTKPDYLPDPSSKPTFDPNFGFKDPRKERVPLITEQEMKALKIPQSKRDYCAHLYRDFMVCFKSHTWHYMCAPERHAYHHCIIEDYEHRMKEYEREKRLRLRQLRKEGKTIS